MAEVTTNEKILNALNLYNEALQEKISDEYVGKVTGKALSTNDFTDELKTKLDNVDEDAQKNIIEGITINGSSAVIDSDTKIASLEIEAGGFSFAVGSTAPENPNTLWLDTSEFEN